jgi:integrase
MTNEDNDVRIPSTADTTTSTEELDEMTPEVIQKFLAQIKDPLAPMSPEDAVNQFLDRETEITDRTKQEYQTKLNYFLKFLDSRGIDDMNDLSGRIIEEYRVWRRKHSTEGDPLAAKTMKDDMHLLSKFLRYLEKIEAVPKGLESKVNIPNVTDEGRDYLLDAETAEQILTHLKQYQYATKEHVLFCLLTETARRLGGIHGLDLGDFYDDESEPYIEFRHRPGETRLKNEESSEGQVALSPATAQVIKDYIDNNRHDVVDKHGRQPLLTTRQGRPAHSTLRRYVYSWTRPCKIGEPCPHGNSPDTCEAATEADNASKCESTRPPHALRHGGLTEMRREGIPVEVIRDRCDVSQQTLEKHYDERSEEEKRRRRQKIVNDARSNGGGYL